MQQPCAISVQNVHKSYGKTKAVNGLSFSVKHAGCFGLLGPNGAGKTTMMKMVYGKAERDAKPEGVINVLGFDPQHNPLNVRHLLGVVPQDDNLDVGLNVYQNLSLFAKFYGLSGSAAKTAIEHLIEMMELTDKRYSKTRELSGGMKRRLIIARALLNNPKILILDEPTTGLDPQVRHMIWDKLRLMKKDGITMLLTTHYMEEAFQLCDDLIIMHKGEKVIEGQPRELLEQSIEKYVLDIVNKERMDKIKDCLNSPSLRADISRETLHIYSNHIVELNEIASQLEPGDYFLRAANLEDLFIKATGRALDDSG
ncbi:ABC transporter ATP-binding protein [Candidatus Magnetominusculus xianensis]|uniref:ABC transporter protein n=1 Tax=Candidatus Magnetominusculus xianensis TaxID=1748249 RepID=A0ABR5SGY1_9BACT|nr:ATP-binding cassette domain-containing protein [Candidatus Magnetominusculus xianensis]KWT90954.1 ABC transporter protein [Candidatus Magnetominusculus xianensis]MBF0403110.1 ATP-binding cassette domain-containing protein [Nitrospirota bacterium]